VAGAWSIKHPVYKPDTNVSASAVAKYVAMTEKQLRALITEKGGLKGSDNVALKTVAYDLARLYQKTKDIKYADRAVILLERYAEVLPKWPIVGRDGKTTTPLAKLNWGDWANGGLWGIWYHQDLQQARELALAYDFIAASGALQARSKKSGKDVAKLIENDLFRYMAEVALRFDKNSIKIAGAKSEDFSYGNMAGNWLRGLMPLGRVVEPAFVHIAVFRLRKLARVGFCRDGYWREGTPSYHKQIVGNMLAAANDLKGHSDPVGYKYAGYTTRFGAVFKGTNARFDNLDVFAGDAAFARAQAARDGQLTLPSKLYYAAHDTHSTQKNWWYKATASEPRLLPGLKYAMLGRGNGADQAQVYLDFTDTGGHEHYDSLNLGMWALGAELLSEGEYKAFGNRDWNTATPGHNTVVVDEKNQNGRFENRAKLTVDDAVDGVGFYRYQSYGQSNGRNYGNLRMWDTERPHLQVVEADGRQAYKGKAALSHYRRTLVMVRIQGAAFYVIDVFRVKGGKTHDWMLHGRLNEDYGFATSLKLAAATGTRYKHLKLTKAAFTSNAWYGEFISKTGARLRTHMLGSAGTVVSVGRAPAQRRAGEATFLDVRRTGGDSLFVAVHEPHTGKPKVVKVTPLTYTGKAGSAVAVRVDLSTGRSDTFAATLDQPPYPKRQVPGGAGIGFQGRLVHVATTSKGPQWMYLLEGARLTMGGIDLAAAKGDLSYRGSVTDIKRKEKGDAFNGFVTTAALPKGSTLAGKTLLLTLPDGRTEGYLISKIVAAGGGSQIHVSGEPGLELRDGGKLVKYVYYPWTGLRGKAISWLIPGSVHRDSAGKVTSTAPLVMPKPDAGTPDAAAPDAAAPDAAAPDLPPAVKKDGCHPGCHWDCFGGVACGAGKVYSLGYGPAPCCRYGDPWPYGGPVCSAGSPVYLCTSKKCAAKVDPRYARCLNLAGNTGKRTWMPKHLLPLMCAEAAARKVGHPCTSDGDCRPVAQGVAPRLVCHKGVCIQAGRSDCAPITFAQHCGVEVDDLRMIGGLPDPSDQVLAGKTCKYCHAAWDSKAGCVRQRCTMPCKFDEDCPTGYACLCATSILDALPQFCARVTDRVDTPGRTAWLGCSKVTKQWPKCVMDKVPPSGWTDDGSSGEDDPGCSCGVAAVPTGAVTWGLVLLALAWCRRRPW